MKHLLYTLLVYMLGIYVTQAQTEQATMTWEDFVEVMTDEYGDEGEEGEVRAYVDEELLERLFELHAQPIDVNKATKEDLAVLPFLSEEQVEGIIHYRERNGRMESLGELMMVKELGRKEREMLRLFVTVMPPDGDLQNLTMGTLLRRSKNEATWRTDVPFYTKEGYKSHSAEELEKSPNKVYRGDRFHHSFRYKFSSMNHLMAGFQMEKDAGERGMDYMSAYVMLNDVGILQRAIVGNYRLSFGKGLAVNTSMKLGKLTTLTATDRMDIGITQHSSMQESGYFTGGAATLQVGQWQVSAFASLRKGDGTYNADSTGMSSLKTDGLHRTRLERSKRNNLGISNFGGNIHWEHKQLRLSATAIATHLDVPLKPSYNTPSTYYRSYNAAGQDFFVGSLAYSWKFSTLTFSGETAMSNTEHQQGTATLNSLRWRVNSSNTLTLIGRYYGAKFVSLNGKAFGENSAVQNEEGIMLGWSTKAIPNTELTTYFDAMHFPWLKHGVSASSNGYEGMFQALYSPSNRWNLMARYRIKAKQRDFTYDSTEKTITTLEYNTCHNFKLQFNYTLTPAFSLRTSLAGTLISFADNKNEKGFAISENIRWQSTKTKCRVDLGIAYFNTDTYNTRIYHYEPSLLYSIGSTTYYYHGLRTTLIASVPLLRQSLFLNAKLGMTRYFDRDNIGSGLELINANHREDLQLQLRWKF